MHTQIHIDIYGHIIFLYVNKKIRLDLSTWSHLHPIDKPRAYMHAYIKTDVWD